MTTANDDNEQPEQADAARMTAQAVERCRIAAKETQNPVYAWEAIQWLWWEATRVARADGEQPAEMAIPGWCAEYFGSIASEICALACGADFRKPQPELDSFGIREAEPLGHKEAMELVPKALGFTSSRGSSNAFAEWRADLNAIHSFARLRELQRGGLSYEAAMLQLADEIAPGKDESMVRKKTTRGGRLVGHLPMHTGKT